MGYLTHFYFKAGEGEQISTTVNSSPDNRSAIIGRVLDRNNHPIEDALVLLFETAALPESILLTAQTFTDESGHFAFGPLVTDTLYLIKVYKDNLKIRELELQTQTQAEDASDAM